MLNFVHMLNFLAVFRNRDFTLVGCYAAYVGSCSLTLGPLLRVKRSLLLDGLTLENGTDRPSHSISKHLPTYAV